MDPISISLTLFFSAATGAVIWWLIQTEIGLRQMREESEANHAQTTSALTSLTVRCADFAESAEALQRAHPGMAGIVEAHRTLDRLDSALLGDGEAGDVRVAAAGTLSCVRSLLAGRDGEGDITAPESADVGLLALVERVKGTFDGVGLSTPELGLSELECRRMGELAFIIGERNWAKSCYDEAARIAPKQAVTLASLALLARDAGDEVALRAHIENLLEIRPDDEELLRDHARLLSRLGDPEAEKDLRRLEAMGVETAEDKSMLAGLAERSGDIDGALEAVEQALSDSPTITDWVRKANLHFERDEPGKGLAAADEALALDRQCGGAWAARARILERDINSHDDALKACIHAVALGEPLQMLKVELLQKAGRDDDALDALRQALEKSPDNPTIRASLALNLHQGGATAEAFALLDAAPAAAWNSPEMYIQKGRLILAEADRCRDGTGEKDRALLSEASLAFEAALGIDRENGVAWLGTARIQRMQGELSEAQISLARARRLIPDEPLISAEEALLALDGGDVEAASRLISEADVRERDNPVIAYVKGVVNARRGLLDEACKQFDDILLSDPGHVRARLNRATARMLLERHDEALDDTNVLLSDHPELDLARLRRGEILMSLGEWQEAEKCFREILDKNGAHPQALTCMGGCMIAQERMSEAEGPLNEAIKLDPSHSEGWYQRGLLYLAFENIDSALTDFETAVRTDAAHLNSLLRIAAIHHGREDWDKAEKAWRGVLNISADSKLARRRLEEATSAIIAGEDNTVLMLKVDGSSEAEVPVEKSEQEENEDEEKDEGLEFSFGEF